MRTIRARLYNAQQAAQAMAEAYRAIKGYLLDGQVVSLVLSPQARSDSASRLLHATIADIAKQLEWAGKKREPGAWKRLLVAAWCRTRGQSVEVLPALDGCGVDIVPARTSKLSRAECSDLQEFVLCWGVEQGVRFTAREEIAA